MTEELRVEGTLLPAGRATELWIRDGLFRFDGSRSAPALTSPGGFLISGLTDCHSHLSWPHDRSSPADSVGLMNANRAAYARSGTTLLRDMGSASDAILGLVDAPGLPSVQAAGMLLLRHDEWPFTPTPPERLRGAAIARVERGASWVKIFTDWSSDYGGRANTGFSGDDEVTYPLDVLTGAVDAVHARGRRVAAHCFTRAGAEVAVRAGVDSLEHGWGVDTEILEAMASRRMGWVPLLCIGAPMYEDALANGERERAAWIVERLAALHALIPRAHSLGVRVLAGTDWFGEVLVPDEIRALSASGLPRQAALAAGTFGAREFLGARGIEEGAPADLVVYRVDPREVPEALYDPEKILIGGRPVAPSPSPRRARRGAGVEALVAEALSRGRR